MREALRKITPTGCGETDESVAALAHAAVFALYTVMLIFHGMSVIRHWSRRDAGSSD